MAKAKKVFESTFETYTEVSRVGEGGSGQVFEVVSSEGKHFAIKCLPSDRVTTEKRKRFQNELAFCEKNQHKNIVKVLDHGFIEFNGTKCPFYVMPLYKQTLRSRLKQGVARSSVLQLFGRILDGVEAAHLQKIWHRDLKPENILLSDIDQDLVVADWGIAHFEEEHLVTVYKTVPQAKLGNYAYAAPEQRIVGGKADHLSDIYALGVILNELFTGQILQGTGYKTIADFDEKYSYLDAIVEKMVRQNPADRYQRIEDVKNELIAKNNEFVALQKVNQVKNTVVPATEPNEPLIQDPPTLTGFDYQGGRLILHLSRAPNPRWIQCFKNPRSNHKMILGKGPEYWNFTGSNASIAAEERQVQELINYFKTYLQMAIEYYKDECHRDAIELETRRRNELRKQAEEAEKRLRILKSASI
jgi:serine/threonine protein kinase